MTARISEPNGTVQFPRVGVGAGSLANAAGEQAFFNMIHAAWASGVRYFDTSAAYLGGVSEQRLGAALAAYPRDELYVSTKLGRYLSQPGASSLPGGSNFYLDYTYDTTLRSVERSLSRLHVDRLGAVFIHDLDPGFARTAYREELKTAVEGAFPALQRLKDEKVVGAIGVASMDWQACLDFAELADVDVVMPAGEYSLLRTRSTALLDHCVEKGIAWIAASPFNSGILATGSRPDAFYNMRPATRLALLQTEGLERICRRHHVSLATAALLFPLRHSAVSTIVFGAKTADEFKQSFARLSENLSDQFWQEMDAFLIETKDWEGRLSGGCEGA
ncbi:D-threo-aldose 1-dehydrogenase [Paraburkholderia sp. CI2]|uniref:aldo/keto reductase n=1 Tax=Paraburkholderia sp. CI2 TaxID=2723093 RepID=UPI00161E90F5|nr:aldo/keto reductase [Paraburkholderia sp. CI2]MBB5464224.1 D-threo-aldose 1-dehydrogenase [Paraburkholderia sp. CI2]